MREVGAALAARGVDPGRVSTEAFGTVAVDNGGIVRHGDRPPPHAPEGAAGTGPAVTFVRSSLTVPWDDRFGSLLDFIEACDVPVGFGCRNGVCHNCESGLLAGEVAYDPDPLEPPAEGRLLVCCSRPAGELTLDL
jgi:ferredoxin